MIEDEFLDKMMASSDSLHCAYYTSMHLDRLGGRAMEIESILGLPLRRVDNLVLEGLARVAARC